MGFLSFFINEWTILLCAIIYAIHKYTSAKYDFFEKKGIPYKKPSPFFGSLADLVWCKKTMFDLVIEYHNEMKHNKFCGMFELRNPLFLLSDPELIKKVTVKDFDHFVNHRSFLTAEDAPLFGNSLFVLKDRKWKDMRATLSPAFTGSKMRLMFNLIDDVSANAITYLEGEARNVDHLEIEMKDFVTRFTNDVIASAAFGIKVDSLADKNNEFYSMGKEVTNFSGIKGIKMFLFASFGPIMRFFKIRLFEQKSSDYFNKIVMDTMKYRIEHGIVRPDMINLLMEARKGALTYDENETKEEESFKLEDGSTTELKPHSHNRSWTDQEIVANCFLFFSAGFDTTSYLMCFCAQELMENPDVQAKLIEEIDAVRANLNGQPLTYEVLQKMKYLDMVVSETLRKWPPAIGTDRVCVKPYTLVDDSTGNKVDLNVGDVVWIPVAGLHHDPEYYPEPKRFNPERFSEENKKNINPFAYLPFGAGPRNCIGFRFALMETKVIIFHMLSKFTLEAGEKSSIPIQLAYLTFQLVPKKGFWIRFKPRTGVST